MSRSALFERVLSTPVVDLKKLFNISWHGVPDEWRWQVWKYLLRYVPVEKNRTEKVLEKKRKEYDILLKTIPKDENEETNDETKIRKQIVMDIMRSNITIPMLFVDKIQNAMKRILFLYALRHPACGYVQGLNDLVVPLLVVNVEEFSMKIGEDVMNDLNESQLQWIEADTYWMFSALLENIQDHYTSEQSAIYKQLDEMNVVLERVDAKLADKLNEENIQIIQFAFRWFNCFLLREFSFKQGLRLWDTYLSDEDGNGFKVFHLYVCVAILKKYSAKLVTLEFADLVQFLQNLPTNEWTDDDMNSTLSEAFVLFSQFKDSPSHLSRSK
ncbi:hypothetical protein EIN_344790 [Entamoeba invadens IP1]|uniref:Rab-GAP TBC domain-containing protein n=1 Tax=Entamoeba invadens IP1 TaxID=370355 RepID=A0A0A1U3B6_ENTIV|nr:hypothetical protein EIN_344790 [Entamoeba invadens IP1]ELP88519.1 hypothetical protein EIN_344790 [Entamoeba invadens IP1]|eukprot:XP_004255290.1 hypothetical protein EIN_344790 [Entamoeba invadens IP1]